MANQQADDDGVVVVGDEMLGRFYDEVPSGELFLIASDRSWNHKQSVAAYTRRISGILQSFDNGRLQKQRRRIDDSFWKSHSHVVKPIVATSGASEAPRGSIAPPQRPNDAPASASPHCPSLVSDTSQNRELRDTHPRHPTGQTPLRSPEDASSPPAPDATGPSGQLSTQGELEPPVLTSVRQVLIRDPPYAEEVVLSLKEPPVTKRRILFNQYVRPGEGDAPITIRSSGGTSTPQLRPITGVQRGLEARLLLAWWGVFRALDSLPRVLGAGPAPLNIPTSYGQVLHGQSSQRKRGKKPPGKHRAQESSGGKSKKKARRSDDNGGGDQGDGCDGSGSGGGGHASIATDRRNKSNSRWACPYSLAFTRMLHIAKFKSCRPPGSLNSRSLWKDHLKEYHSPEARLSNPNTGHSLFYMNDEQWERVQARIAEEKHTRPRKYEVWFEAQKKCFLEVWRIIFPETQFSPLHEPISPFHPDNSSPVALGHRARILLDSMYEVRARRAVDTGSVETMQNFRPTHEQYMELITEALTIVTNELPGAPQWLTNVPLEALQAAVRNHSLAVREAGVGGPDSDATSSLEPTLEPGSESNDSDNSTASAVSVVPTIIPLFPDGNRIYLEVSPNYATGPSRVPAHLEVTHPRGFDVTVMRRIFTAPSTLAATFGIAPQPPTLNFSWPAESNFNPQCIDPRLMDASGLDVFGQPY